MPNLSGRRYAGPSKRLRLQSLSGVLAAEGLSAMGAFLDNFRPDPDSDGTRQVWRTTKPLLQDAVVVVAPPYPDYPKMKVSRHGPDTSPSCPSARDASSEIEVHSYADSGSGFGTSYQEKAWEFMLAHAPTIEAALRRKLFAWHRKQLMQFREEDLPTAKALQKYWETIEKQVPVEEPAAVNHLFKLVVISLNDSGLDEYGFIAFEFQTGWDHDHGVGILMHRDRVLAAGAMGEMIYGSSIAAGARATQEYDLDDGDFSLLNV
jgi:hypothetical protein